MNEGKDTDVTLPEVSNACFERAGTLDPQRVMVRQNNQATIYIDTVSQRVLSGDSKLDITIASGARANTLADHVRRLAPRSFGITWYIPNVNPRNNTLTFFSTTSGTQHTVVIPEGFYFRPGDFMDELVIQLNTVTGASGRGGR